MNEGKHRARLGVCPSAKKGYPTRAAAKKAANKLRKLGIVRQKPYKCPDCPIWHLTVRGRSYYERNGL